MFVDLAIWPNIKSKGPQVHTDPKYTGSSKHKNYPSNNQAIENLISEKQKQLSSRIVSALEPAPAG